MMSVRVCHYAGSDTHKIALDWSIADWKGDVSPSGRRETWWRIWWTECAPADSPVSCIFVGSPNTTRSDMRMHLEARSLTTELGNVVPDPQ